MIHGKLSFERRFHPMVLIVSLITVEILQVIFQLMRRTQVESTARGLKIDNESVWTKPRIPCSKRNLLGFA